MHVLSQTFPKKVTHHNLLLSQEQNMQLSMDKQRKWKERDDLAILGKEKIFEVKDEEVKGLKFCWGIGFRQIFTNDHFLMVFMLKTIHPNKIGQK